MTISSYKSMTFLGGLIRESLFRELNPFRASWRSILFDIDVMSAIKSITLDVSVAVSVDVSEFGRLCGRSLIGTKSHFINFSLGSNKNRRTLPSEKISDFMVF